MLITMSLVAITSITAKAHREGTSRPPSYFRSGTSYKLPWVAGVCPKDLNPIHWEGKADIMVVCPADRIL